MKRFLSSLREDPEKTAAQCVQRLWQATGESPAEAGKCTALARLLVDGLADSVEAMDPGRFMDSIDACRPDHATMPGPSPFPLSGIIATLEEMVTEQEFDAEQARFLWRLFCMARGKTTAAAVSSVSEDESEPEITLAELKREVAERRRAEKELRESERRFRDIAEFIPQIIFEMDADCLLTFVNRQAYDIYGYTPRDVKKGVMGLDLVHPSDLPRIRQTLQAIAEGKPSTGSEFTAVRKDGSTFPVIAHVARIMKGGRLAGWRGIIVDITERKQAEEKLKESERKFRDIAELSPQVIFEQGPDGVVTYANKRGLELFGYTEADLTSGAVMGMDLFPEHEHARVRENLAKMIAGERETTGNEYTARRKDGSTFPAIIYTIAIFSQDRLTGLRGVLVDTTDLKKADRELRERERRFRDLAESVPQVIFEMNETRRITFANRQAFQIFGYDEEDLSRGIDAFSLFVPEQLPAMSENLRRIARGEASTGNEYTALRKDGTSFPVIIHVAPILDEGRLVGFRGIIVDITERKKAEEELRESRQFLQDIADRIPGVIYQFYAKPGGEMGLSYISRTAKELFGIETDTSRPFERFLEGLSPDCREALLDSISEAVAKEQDWQFEGDFIKPAGEVMSFAGVSRPSRVGDTLRFNGVLLDITSRKRAEEQLRESERKFRDIAELMPQVIFEIDPKGSVIFVNKQAFEFFGYKEDDLPEGFNCFDHIAPEDRSRAIANLQKAAEDGPSVGNQYAAVKKDGSRFPIIIYVTRIIKDGRLTGYRGIIIDISERTRAEEALKQGEKRLRQIIDLVPHFIFAKDIDGRFILANKAVADNYGTTVEGLIGRMDASFSPSDEEVRHFRNDDLDVMITGRRKYIPGESITDAQGNVRYLETVKIPFTFSGTQTPAVLGVSVDITERMEAERAIARSEQELRTIIAASPIGIGRIRDRIIEWVNEAMCNITGYAIDELTRTSTRILYEKGSEFDRVGALLYRDFQGETKWVRKDGQVLDVLVQLSPMEGGAYIFTTTDITRLKRAESTLKFTQFSVDNAVDSIYWIDNTGSIAYVNNSACLSTGYDRHELLSMKIYEIEPDRPARDWPRYWRNIVEKGSEQFESVYRRKDGTTFPVEVSVSYLPYDEFEYVCAFSRDITERRKAEEALKESEERWQFALEGAGDGLWDWNAQAGTVYFSGQWKEMIGYADKEIGDSIEEWDTRLHPDDRDDVHARLEDHLEGRSSVYISQYRMRCKDGTYKWILDRGKVIRWTGDGRPLRVIGTHTDITEHKRTEERLRLDESRTEALLRIHQMGNRPLEEITAFTLEESIRFTKSAIGYLAFLNDDESVLTMHSWSKKAMEECRIQDKPISYPLETTGMWGDPVRRRRPIITNDYAAPGVTRKGHPEGHVEVRRHLGVPIFDGERIVAVIGVGNKENEYGESDINQLQLMAQGMIRLLKQKAAQEALSVSESRLRAVIDSARDAIFIKDRDRRYIVANGAMSELFGIPMQKILGATDRELFPDKTADHIETVDGRVLKGETIEEEMARPVAATVYVFHTIKVPLKNDRGEITGLCGIARDITERKHLESQLLQSQKMEAVGTLAGGVAHDFNNLLSAIMGYASLLQMKMDKENPLYGYASQILVSSEKAANLTQSLLAFSRKQVINLKPVVINDTVEKLHRLLERLIPEDVEFRIHRNSERLVVMADPGQLDQVIMNLVTNARDAMPRGGKLTITVDRATVGNEFITTHGYGRAGEYALIAISDTGIGMDSRVLEKIFEPFFTTKGVGRGTGLGLAIVYGIIKQHNGYIDVTSRPGEGSVFCVYLPLVWLEPAREERSAAIIGGTETVLIAEDNADLCQLSVQVLQDHGYTVLAANDGAMAVETFRRHRGEISLVILDVVMPRMNGKEACEAIRLIDPSTRVIFTSGYTDDIIQEKGMLNEEYDFLGKPITPATLLRKIREVLDRK
ncbi:MAG TPA: PAS domain S-box protein [Syntrophorhabdaceae bacterium]|nr:PAS domain S-box protein [Syntrophorhabdaceae bacterium]HOD74390.1 PAS domain S-box protein [Syntrophorhabdaceae bacterium]